MPRHAITDPDGESKCHCCCRADVNLKLPGNAPLAKVPETTTSALRQYGSNRHVRHNSSATLRRPSHQVPRADAVRRSISIDPSQSHVCTEPSCFWPVKISSAD